MEWLLEGQHPQGDRRAETEQQRVQRVPQQVAVHNCVKAEDHLADQAVDLEDLVVDSSWDVVEACLELLAEVHEHCHRVERREEVERRA